MSIKNIHIYIHIYKRLEIFKSFYHTDFNNDMKRTFVSNRVTKADIERRRSRNDPRLNKRRVALKYSFNTLTAIGGLKTSYVYVRTVRGKIL